MATIKQIWAREILDSRGMPTIEVAGQLDSGQIAVFSVPAGASTGSHEAIELRDQDEDRFYGKGVLKAVNNVNTVLAQAVLGKDPSNQEEIDNILINLDGTPNKSKLGANAILAVSGLALRLGAIANNLTLYSWVLSLMKKMGITVYTKIPTPIFNIVNGGLHGASNLDFQEFHIVPVSFKSYSEGLRMAAEIYMVAGNKLRQKGAIHSVGDEGGFAPNLFTNMDALELLVESIKQTRYGLGRDVFLGLDAAASVFYKNGSYQIKDKTSPLDKPAMLEYYKVLNDQYHLAILEDPLEEDDWEGWKKITEMLASETIIVGDDLLVTNPEKVQKAITEKACTAVLVKPNQVGTISETLKVIKLARENGLKIVVSHRSGETNDWFIADFAVGVGADYVKFGAPARGERVAKYNRLLTIESEISAYLKQNAS
ncbi:MAG: Enolase [Candidatus Woesebacteria bacterium]|nr:MAG: Enolase [Candidatus Woesebacteria bacterium]